MTSLIAGFLRFVFDVFGPKPTKPKNEKK